MLQAMMAAHVGDDVFGEDPSVNELENYCASLFDMDGALFCPSGTMTNQIAIKCHTQPGEEIICDKTSHVYIYEGGGIAFNSGCQVQTINGDRGMINAGQVEAAVNADDVHKAASSLVCLENTANRGGGGCYVFEEIVAIKNVCNTHGLKLHMDGARLFNALSATGESEQQYGEIFDSISICLSKGLGAPVGSILLGDNNFIKKARRVRKVLGGGMRQAGFMAAAGLYGLQQHRHALALDHEHAKQIAAALIKKQFVGKMLPVETNIIIFELKAGESPVHFCDFMKKHDVLCLPISPTQVRMVTHLDVTSQMVGSLVHLIDAM